jgi:hypothetical protein
MRNSLFIFKCRESDKDRSIHNFKECLYPVKEINRYGRFHNPTLKSPLIKCAFKVNATLNLK